MKNKPLTTIEIKEWSITIATTKTFKNKPISIFNETKFFDIPVLNSNGLVIEPIMVKKALGNIFNQCSLEFSKEYLKEVICILPSQTYIKTPIKNSFRLSADQPINKEMIDKLKLSIEKKLKENDHNEIFNLNFENILVNDKKWENFEEINGSLVTFIYNYETIDKAVYKSHTSIVKSFGKQISKIVPNIQALFNIPNSGIKTPENAIIINWENNKVEFGVFKKNSIQTFKTLNQGFDKVIEKMAKKFNIDENLCRKYLFESLDLNSNNFLSNIILKVKNFKNEYEFNGYIFKKEFIKQIDEVLKKITEIISQSLGNELFRFPIYHYGILTQITNISKFFKTKTTTNNFFGSFSLIGTLNECILATTYGVWNTIDTLIKNEKSFDKLQPKKVEANLSFDFFNHPSENGYMQALFLKQDGIIIDKVKPNEGEQKYE
ncbi:hypothetical protein [Mesoplasma corruscae]|uniref:Cell division protein FtsA n=1 Tax=Mesoplasma corruscae TaxID=216874 RepID=A0A2S5RG02_9MOLU|nr:hypothetical protein [Mesoplasma corruscae]PPE06266.1 hypothetical protein MCORR_v1c05710 [Mesoplasma corruscae]